jgi:hypothetical protein
MRDPATLEDCNPSSCPSPSERRDVEATVEPQKLRTECATPLPLHPHPLADADRLRCKLAKARLQGEAQGEGRFAQFETPSALKLARIRISSDDERGSRHNARRRPI